MAQTQEPVIGQKRGPGRPPKIASQPPPKRQKLAAATEELTPIRQIILESPAPSTSRLHNLAAKVSNNAPLQTLPRAQSPDLPDSEWQSIAASGVLAASFERSRQSWTQDGVFQRFWTKPQKAKDNDKVLYNSMKDKGKCRLRIEPHIFEVQVWVVERPAARQAIPKVQPAAAKPAYGVQYGQHTYGQGQTLPPIRQQQPPPRTTTPAGSQPLPPIQSRQTIAPHAVPRPTPPTTNKKPSPDPVISMLASRASSDPELKGLMKEVATGNATPEQLKVFQKHIDELTAVIQARQVAEEQEKEKAAQPKIPPQYDGASDAPTPQPVYHHQLPPQPKPYAVPAPAPPTAQEVVFAFTAPGSTEDRFLFPQYSILEPLSAQHVLASFIVTRFGRDIASYAALDLDPEAEYWQPVTMMVEVAYGREMILKYVTSWVKSAEETREEMKKTMARCTRAPERFLATRLPIKGTAPGTDSEVTSKAGTPVVFMDEKKKPAKAKATGAAQKRASLGKQTPAGKGRVGEGVFSIKDAGAAGKGTPIAATVVPKDVAMTGTDGAGEGKDDAAETGRPRRTTRKSVRISGAA